MKKIVYNACYGGFSLSRAAVLRYAELKGITLYPRGTRWEEVFYLAPPENGSVGTLYDRDIPRNDPDLARVVEELGDGANGPCAKLKIEEVPDGTLYRINEYDGFESVETQSTIEWSVA